MPFPDIGLSKSPRAHVVNGLAQFLEHVTVIPVQPNSGEDRVDCINRLTALHGASLVLINGLPIGSNGERAEVGGAPTYGSPT